MRWRETCWRYINNRICLLSVWQINNITCINTFVLFLCCCCFFTASCEQNQEEEAEESR